MKKNVSAGLKGGFRMSADKNETAELPARKTWYFLTHPHQGMVRIRAAELEIDGQMQTNVIVVEFSAHLPNAEQIARELVGRLNG